MSLEAFTLVDGASTATVVPGRGGLVTGFRVGDDEVLFLDPATLADETKNVRGGIPVLFPFAGKPPSGSPLKQHGFARTLPWRVTESEKARLVCVLEANDATRTAFPHDFRLELAVRVAGPALSLTFKIENRGQTAMPLHFGLHPYFSVPIAAKQAARVETDATTAFNQRRGLRGPLPKIDFGGAEVDLHLLDHSAPRTVLHAAHDVALDWTPNFTTLVLWTVPGQPFVCVEPWSAPAGTVGQRTLAPTAAAEVFDFKIRLDLT